MKNKIILGLASLILLSIFSLNLISASGLCRGYDGYYHDCDDYRYFDNGDYDDEYYYHGKYYPTRDYYYRDYYRPRCRNRYRKYDQELHYEDTEEYNRVIVYDYEDRWIDERLKYTISEKTEYELDYDRPYYVYKYDYPRYRDDYRDNRYYDDKEDDKWHDFWYGDYHIPYTSYWYKNN